MDSWNAIGKHWLQKYDNKFGVDYFLCKCSDIKGLNIASIPKYYQDAMQAWNNFLGSCSTESKNDILDKNSEIKFIRNPLFFILWTKTIIPLLITRLYLIDWMIKGTGYQNGQKYKKINTRKFC